MRIRLFMGFQRFIRRETTTRKKRFMLPWLSWCGKNRFQIFVEEILFPKHLRCEKVRRKTWCPKFFNHRLANLHSYTKYITFFAHRKKREKEITESFRENSIHSTISQNSADESEKNGQPKPTLDLAIKKKKPVPLLCAYKIYIHILSQHTMKATACTSYTSAIFFKYLSIEINSS